MADPHHHSLSSVQKWGGLESDYLEIHRWFDESKNHFSGPQHRALRHHSQGIADCISVFGQAIPLSTCAKCGDLSDDHGKNHEFLAKRVPTRWVGEQHVQEDMGRIPSLGDWFSCMEVQPWMHRGARKLSRELKAV